MGMVFCRGCGKAIHDSASTCPHCGAIQKVATTSSEQTAGYLILVPIASLVFGIICLLAFFDGSSWDKEAITGLGYSSAIGLFLGVISLGQLNFGKGIAITGVVLSSIALIAYIGMLSNN